MKILIVGNGGREHALLWKLHQEEPSATFYATRPNPGMAALAKGINLAPTAAGDLASWAEGEGIALTVVGPEVPLAMGIVERFRSRGLAIFGPTSSAARIESSKAYAKDVMRRAGVPTAEYGTFSDIAAAEAFIREREGPLVVKASGLAAGKGVILCSTTEEAVEAAREMLEANSFGEAGNEIVVEEFMEGEELSVFGVTDGREVAILLPSQDHKRIGEGDTGPNTGGMGAYAPLSFVTRDLIEDIRTQVYLPTLDEMQRQGNPFRGLLYAGLMMTSEGIRVIEFNCRFGDPETQAVLPLMSSSLLECMVPVARGGTLSGSQCKWSEESALNTVLSAEGYPATYRKGDEITIPSEVASQEGVLLFHSGTRTENGRLLTDGGRVLSVVGVGSDIAEARARSLAAAEAIQFEGKNFRRDIGWRAFPAGR
jgi:phosphoribosylamine--glycine ligase